MELMLNTMKIVTQRVRVYKAAIQLVFSFFEVQNMKNELKTFFRIKSRRYSRALTGCSYRPIRLGQLGFHKLLLGQIEMS